MIFLKIVPSEMVTALSPIEKLTPEHCTGDFCCGKSLLDEWLRKFALTNQRSGIAQTYVVNRTGKVVGFYALSAGSVFKENVPIRVAQGVPNHPIPIVVLGRLAVDQAEKGRGLGSALLKDAMIRVEQAAGIIGIRALLVHALDEEARAFYERFNFIRSPFNEMQLILLMKDLRALLHI